MVRLKKTANMLVFKDISVNINNHREEEAWVAVMDTVVAINCREFPFYDCLISKRRSVLQETEHHDTVKITVDDKSVLFRFGSYKKKIEFCNAVRTDSGYDVPPPSPTSSATPSPPSSL